jgi:mannosyltransferase
MAADTQTATAARVQAPSLAGVAELVSRHAVLLIVLGGAVIRFATLDSQGFWIDEHVQIRTVSQPGSELLPTILNAETQPPLYLVIAKAWQAVFGLGEVGIRSLSAVAGIATIPVVYAAGRLLGSPRAGLIAAALTAASPFMIWYSQEARPYALFGLFSALSFLFFLQALNGRGVRPIWAWAIASLLAFSTHYFGILLTGVEAVWLLWSLRRRRIDVVLAIAAIAAASIPLVLLGTAQQHFTAWIDFLPAGDRLAQVPQNLLVGLATPWEVLPAIVVGLVFLAVLYVIVTAKPESLRPAIVPLGVAAAGGAITVVALIAGSDYLVTRNLIGFWAPLVLALSVVLAAPETRRIGTAVAAVLCVTGAGLAIWQAATPEASRPDWKPLADALGPAEVPRAIEYASPFAAPMIHDLPNSFEPVAGDTATVEEIDIVEFRQTENHSIGPCWWQGVCGGEQVVGEPGGLFFPVPRDYEVVEEGQTDLFTYRRYRGPPVELPAAGAYGNHVIVQTP